MQAQTREIKRKLKDIIEPLSDKTRKLESLESAIDNTQIDGDLQVR
jgi:hypothetical protein